MATKKPTAPKEPKLEQAPQEQKEQKQQQIQLDPDLNVMINLLNKAVRAGAFDLNDTAAINNIIPSLAAKLNPKNVSSLKVER